MVSGYLLHRLAAAVSELIGACGGVGPHSPALAMESTPGPSWVRSAGQQACGYKPRSAVGRTQRSRVVRP